MSNNPESILIKRQLRSKFGRCASCINVTDNYMNYGIVGCNKENRNIIDRFDYSKDCSDFSYNIDWDK